MKNKSKIRDSKVVQVVSALIWAAVILTTSYVLKEVESNKFILNMLIVSVGLQLSLLTYFWNKYSMKKKGKCSII